MSLGDDEYDYWKAEAGNAMRDRMGLADNPLDGVVARVCTPSYYFRIFVF
jgi:endoplasmic reticulum-Golgi intermediate compartment protein 3